MVMISLDINEELLKEFDEKAEKEKRSRSNLIKKVISEYLQND